MADAPELMVDLSALAANYAHLCRAAGSACRVGAAVKANGYGLGLMPVATRLHNAGCDLFFVANLDEALALRRFFPRVQIAVLEGLTGPKSAALYKQYRLTPILNAAEQLPLAREVFGGLGRSILHLDTGMNRLGIRFDEFTALHENGAFRDGKPYGLMSHFACADEVNHPMTETQYELFRQAAARLPGVRCSIANSSGLLRDRRYAMDFARPGMGLYGLNPLPERPNPMRPVVTLSARVLQVREIRPGESVGYGASHTQNTPGRLATIGIGYADGFLRALGNGKGRVFWHGQACPVVGRVSMDLTAIDLSGLPDDVPLPVPGDRVEILGSHQSADALGACAGTIGYEILTDLSRRAARTYINVANPVSSETKSDKMPGLRKSPEDKGRPRLRVVS